MSTQNSTPPAAPVDLHKLQTAIELHLEGIEKIMPNYRLTLIARYDGPLPLKDANLLLTMDERESVMTVVDRFLPAKKSSEPTKDMCAREKRELAGSCNACQRRDKDTVIAVYLKTISFRVCDKCATELAANLNFHADASLP